MSTMGYLLERARLLSRRTWSDFGRFGSHKTPFYRYPVPHLVDVLAHDSHPAQLPKPSA